MYYSLPIILLLATIVVALDSKCSTERIDLLASRLNGFNRHFRKYPESVAQIPEYCRSTRADINEATTMNEKCNKGAQKQLTSILLYSIKNVLKNYCSKKSKDKRKLPILLKVAKCWNENLGPINKCWRHFQDKLTDAMSLESRHRIPLMCCEFYVTKNCLIDSLTPACPDQVDEVQNSIENVSGNMIDAICGDYTDSSDKCSTLPKPAHVKPTKKWSTFFVPLIELWASTE